MKELEFLTEGLNLLLQTEKVESAMKSSHTKVAMLAVIASITAVAEKVKHQASFVDGSVSASGDGTGATVAVNSQMKVDLKDTTTNIQKEIPFRGNTSDKSKGKEAGLADTKSDVSTKTSDVPANTEVKQPDTTPEVKGEDTTASTTQEAIASENSTEQAASSDVKDEAVVTAETEIGNTEEEIDEHAKERMTVEDAYGYIKEYMSDLFAKGKRNNDRKVRQEVNELIMNTFPITEEESKQTKEGNIKRNKLQDQLWRELASEAKEKLAKKENKVNPEASKSVDNLIDSVKAELQSEKIVDEPTKVSATTDLEKTKVVTAEEIQTAATTEESKTVEVIAETEEDDMVKIANEAAAQKTAEEAKEESKVVNLPEVDLSKCTVGEFFDSMKETLADTSSEDLDNKPEILKKWVDLLNSGASMPDRANLIGANASNVIKSIFGVIKKQNLKRKAA